MAKQYNICTVRCKFYSDNMTDLIDFRDELTEYITYRENWLGNILNGFGLYYKLYPCNGIMTHCTRDIETTVQSVNYFDFNYDSENFPTYSMWEAVLSAFNLRHGVDIKQAFIAYQTETSLYVKQDFDDMFYPETFAVNFTDVNRAYDRVYFCKTKKDTVDLINHNLSEMCIYASVTESEIGVPVNPNLLSSPNFTTALSTEFIFNGDSGNVTKTVRYEMDHGREPEHIYIYVFCIQEIKKGGKNV